MKQAGIYVNDTYCGVLTEDEEGFHFVYDKNFSLIDSGNGEYNLAPAYDLLAVLLADPADTEEMAMSFTVGGTKSGFDRNTFMTAFTQSGIPVAIAEKMIERMKGYLPEWEELIGQSFLPENMKADYLHLLNRRIDQLR